jgi:hypothetical protein
VGIHAIKNGPEMTLPTSPGPDRNPSSNPRTTTLNPHKAGEAPAQDAVLKSFDDWTPVSAAAAALVEAARKRGAK